MNISGDQAEHTRRTRDAYDQLAAVWSATTDEGPFNGFLERPALRSLVPSSLRDAAVLDAGCGSGAQARWLLDQGADVVGIDLSPRMVEEAKRRCGGQGRFLVADLAEPLPLEPGRSTASPARSPCTTCTTGACPFDLSHRRCAQMAGLLFHWTTRSGHPPTQRGGYFDTELATDTWRKGDVEVSQQFWRRPLSATLDAFAAAGFVVDRVAEPQPSDEALMRFPDELAGLVGVPVFIVYRLWLRA